MQGAGGAVECCWVTPQRRRSANGWARGLMAPATASAQAALASRMPARWRWQSALLEAAPAVTEQLIERVARARRHRVPGSAWRPCATLSTSSPPPPANASSHALAPSAQRQSRPPPRPSAAAPGAMGRRRAHGRRPSWPPPPKPWTGAPRRDHLSRGSLAADPRPRAGAARRAAAAAPALALDELYGEGRGEGSALRSGRRSAPALSVRAWSAELEALFGAQRARAGAWPARPARGRGDAPVRARAGAVTPSVELLEQVLSLKGGLSEDRLHVCDGWSTRVVPGAG